MGEGRGTTGPTMGNTVPAAYRCPRCAVSGGDGGRGAAAEDGVVAEVVSDEGAGSAATAWEVAAVAGGSDVTHIGASA